MFAMWKREQIDRADRIKSGGRRHFPAWWARAQDLPARAGGAHVGRGRLELGRLPVCDSRRARKIFHECRGGLVRAAL
jgi:hypothetical protein